MAASFLVSEGDLKNLLLDAFIIDKEELKLLTKEAEKNEKNFLDLLFEKNFVSEKYLTKLVADFLKLPFIDLSQVRFEKPPFNIIPRRICEEKKIIPFLREEGRLFLAMADPRDKKTIKTVNHLTGLKVVPFLASEKDIYRTLFRIKQNIQTGFKKIAKEAFKKFSRNPQREAKKLINAILEFAFFERSAEILIEEAKKNILVCFKVNGGLREVINLPQELFSLMVADLKKRLNIYSKEKDFKGSFYFRVNKESFSLPVFVSQSFLKRIKIIIPQEEYLESGFVELGLKPIDIIRIKNKIRKPEGIIVITGPPHSGKTTFFYTLLRMLNQEEKNICSFEDDVRESIFRITQIEKRSFNNASEEKVIRAIISKRPEVVAVDGPFKSESFEELALYANLGNMVVLKINSENVFEALLSLIKLVKEDYLAVLGIKIIIAERLLRRICPFCLSEEFFSKEKQNKLRAIAAKEDIDLSAVLDKNSRFYSGRGCKHCLFTGFQGQVGIFEVLEIDRFIYEAIRKGLSGPLLKKRARQNGFTSLFENALEKATRGETSLREVVGNFK